MAAPNSPQLAMIVQILNVFAPKTGANVGQLVTRADGSHKAYGDCSLIGAALDRMGVVRTPELTAALESCEQRASDPLPASSPTGKRTRRKVSSSAHVCANGHAETAAGVE